VRIVGIGVDLVEVERVRRILERRPTFRERVFTSEEVARCDETPDPAPCLAARWAAREAAAKALGGVPGVRWHDIRVEVDEGGRPSLSLDGSAKARADEVGAERILLSLSHERSVAAAFCVAVGA
jgi:holo-[acyl-carrier protein] synthase